MEEEKEDKQKTTTTTTPMEIEPLAGVNFIIATDIQKMDVDVSTKELSLREQLHFLPLNSETVKRLRQRFPELDDKTLEDMRQKSREVQEKRSTTLNPKTGKREPLPEVLTEEHIKRLGKEGNMVLVPRTKETVVTQKMQRETLLKIPVEKVLTTEELPLCKGKIPLDTLSLHMFKMNISTAVDLILTHYPLMPLPIWTPPLFLFLTGEVGYKCMNSFKAFRFYVTVIQFIRESTYFEKVRSRKATAIKWFEDALEAKQLTFAEFRGFLRHTHFDQDRMPSELHQQLQSVNSAEAFEHLTLDQWKIYKPFIQSIDGKADDFRPLVFQELYDQGREFIEDTYEDFDARRLEAFRKFREAHDMIAQTSKRLQFQPFIDNLYSLTRKLLFEMELFIMLALRDYIPRAATGDLRSNPTSPMPKENDVADEVVQEIADMNDLVQSGRNKSFQLELPQFFQFTDQTVKKAQFKWKALPRIEHITSFLRFFNMTKVSNEQEAKARLSAWQLHMDDLMQAQLKYQLKQIGVNIQDKK